MPVLSLTEVSVRNLRPPPAGQVTYFDKQLRGFGCRVSASGVRAWVVVAGRNRARTTIGRYPTISLKEARKLAGELLAEHTLGKRRPPRLSFSAALDLYVDNLAQTTRESTKKGTERLLKNHFLPSLQHHQLADLQTHEITKITDRLMQRGQPGAANHAFAAMRSMLRFCVKRRLIPHSPLEGLGLPSRAKARERVLDGDELKAVWRAAETHGWPFGRIVQLLILTGARRQEIGSLRADYIADRVCTLPGDVTKNNREQIFPLGDLAADIIKNNPIQEGYLFPARGKRDRPFNGWSGAKRSFDKACGVDFDLHDLRRTFATLHARIGTPPHVIERLLNHASGAISGVAAIYNRFNYLEPMAAAQTAFEAELRRIVEAP